MNTKKFRTKLKLWFHYIRVYGAIISGNKTSRMSKLVDSVIYELRLLTMITFIIVGLYIFETIMEDPTEPEFYQWMIKVNLGIVGAILFLVIKVVIKITSKHHTRCDLPEHNHFNHPHLDPNATSAQNFVKRPDCYKTCNFVNKPPRTNHVDKH